MFNTPGTHSWSDVTINSRIAFQNLTARLNFCCVWRPDRTSLAEVTEKDNAPPQSQMPPADRAPARPGLSKPEQWVDAYGDYLFRYAMVHLRDATKAEDAVQETFLAALKGGKSFAGRSAEKSWLIGILKNKIADYYRKASRETSFTDMEFYSDEESGRFVPDGLFRDSWIDELGPREWSSPGASLDSEVFWRAYRDCSSKLPKNVAAVFNLREVDGFDGKEICAMLNVSESNLWVMLHRARMALRRCMEVNWFGKEESPE
jgi:RNA polymerase sigma-70 factor, ECF subfamily